MRKILLLTAIAVLLALAACSGGGKEPLPDITESTTSNTVRVTFREGLAAVEVANLLAENGVCAATDFIRALKSPEYAFAYLDKIPNPSERPYLLEGYIFPDTYEFYYNEDAQAVLTKFLKNFESKIAPDDVQRAEQLGYSIDEILRIASIIQEEAVDPQMPTVSSVLHNRLDSAYGKLECDVTIFYINDFVTPYIENGNEIYAPLYNAYKFSGLPAGPISNPGRAAIEAALSPSDTDYYFFLTDENGGFHYAVTWEEHKKNVDLYYK